jgi:hypothetical protein
VAFCGIRLPVAVVGTVCGMTAGKTPIDSQTPTSPHLSRLVWLAEQITTAADELAGLFTHDAVMNDLTEQEHALLRQAVAAARTAGGDVVIASAAHHRAAGSSS